VRSCRRKVCVEPLAAAPRPSRKRPNGHRRPPETAEPIHANAPEQQRHKRKNKKRKANALPPPVRAAREKISNGRTCPAQLRVPTNRGDGQLSQAEDTLNNAALVSEPALVARGPLTEIYPRVHYRPEADGRPGVGCTKGITSHLAHTRGALKVRGEILALPTCRSSRPPGWPRPTSANDSATCDCDLRNPSVSARSSLRPSSGRCLIEDFRNAAMR